MKLVLLHYTLNNCTYSVWNFHSFGVVAIGVEGGDGDGGR